MGCSGRFFTHCGRKTTLGPTPEICVITTCTRWLGLVYVQHWSPLPNYRDIDVEGEEERLPYLGNSEFYAWQQIPESDVRALEQSETELPFLPSQLRFEQSEPQLPSAPTGSTGGAPRRIQGNIRLPPLPPPPDSILTQGEDVP